MKTKKMAKRLLVCVLALAIVMSMCSIFVGAAGDDFKISASPGEIKGGDTVTVTVTCQENIGFENVELFVFYDKANFTYDKFKKGAAYNDYINYADDEEFIVQLANANISEDSYYGWGFAASKNSETQIASPGFKFGGTLFTLSFIAKNDIKPGSYDFDLSFDKTNKLAKTGSVTVGDGKKNVSAGTPTTVKVKADTVDVASVTLNKSSLTLEEEKSETLTATVKPDDATDKTVKWKSDKESVATVDNNGKVTAVKEGTAKITATAGGKSATCDVTVTKKPEVIITPSSITIPASETLKLGQSKNLTATLSPEGATGTVKWASDASDVVKVDNNGKITGLKVGTANITASVGAIESNVCAVTVEAVPLNNIAVNPTEAEIEEGTSKNLAVVYDPADTTDDKTVNWSSSDGTIATVDPNGKVTGVKEGEATITAKVGIKEATCKIKVVKAPETPPVAVTGVKLNKSSISISVDGEETLKATVIPDDAANKNVTWSSSDNTIATVDSNGKVKGIAKGTATITVTTEDGGFTAECKVSVMTKDEYNEYVKTADPSLYVIALAIAVMSVMAMAVLLVVKKRQSVR
ncbi:MAG: Ig domain-containing protein [Clostridia bacterium]|nr:Ig domain-containing protein [Clostridia bacterium]